MSVPNTVTFGSLAEGELFFRPSGVVLYQKRAGDGVQLHDYGDHKAGASFAVGATARVYRPKLKLDGRTVTATHPMNATNREACPAAATAPVGVHELYVAHLRPGDSYYGYGPYGTTDWYEVNSSLPGAGHVNVTHRSTGRQLLGSPVTRVERLVPKRAEEPAAPTLAVNVIVAPQPAYFHPQVTEQVTGLTSRNKFVVYDRDGEKRLLNLTTGKDAGPLSAMGLSRCSYVQDQPTPSPYTPKLNHFVLVSGRLYRVRGVEGSRVILDGLFGETHQADAVACKKVVSASVNVTTEN